MPIYVEQIKDQKTCKKIDKLVDGKKQYYVRTYIEDEFGNKKQITRHNKNWLGRDGYWEAQQEENRLRNTIFIKPIEVTFEELCDEFLEYQKKINKESTYYTNYKAAKKWIIPHFQKKIKYLSCTDFILWREYVDKQSLALKTKNRLHILLSNIIKYGIKQNYIQNNYEQLMGSFKEKNEKIKKDKIKYITYEQFKEFIKNIDNIDWKTFFIFLYYTGMRKGEVQALTWEDIDFNNNKINVSKNLTNKVFNAPYKITNTKTKENRKVDMDSFLIKTMLDYYDVKSKKADFSKSDFVFGSKKPLARTTIDRYKKYYERAIFCTRI